MELGERVLVGAAFLDRVKPDWFGLIELERFDMRWEEFGLLGSMFHGDPDLGLAIFDMDPGEAAWHGFDVEPDPDLPGVQHRLDELTRLWVAQVERRRNAAA
jgi:hypothetical protein